MRQTAGVNRRQIAAIEQRGQTHSERNRPARAAMPTAREGNAVTGTRCQTRARATRQQKRTAERARGQPPRQNRNAERKPQRQIRKDRDKQVQAPRQHHNTHRAPKPTAPTEPPRQPRSSPRPNSAFPRRSPARTHACAGAKTGRHLSPRRLTIHNHMKTAAASPRQRGTALRANSVSAPPHRRAGR